MAHTDMAGTHTPEVDPATGRDRPQTTAPGGALPTAPHAHLDLKALRMAVHGWWLGNPLVYKPGAPDLVAIARELAAAGAASGTIVVSDVPAVSTMTGPSPAPVMPPATPSDRVDAVLILRPSLPLSGLILTEAALRAVEATAKTLLSPESFCPCAIRWPSEVVLGPAAGQPARQLCSVEVEEYAGAAYVRLRLALDTLSAAERDGCIPLDDGGQGATGVRFVARPDWREVFLARVLHTLEGRLKEVS
ncbi:MAG TPA: hypothetical protein VJQ45_03660 [Ktedonobacterales bacterium]|nr:hypothetical protein [Ktedonobacterales bacterium]